MRDEGRVVNERWRERNEWEMKGGCRHYGRGINENKGIYCECRNNMKEDNIVRWSEGGKIGFFTNNDNLLATLSSCIIHITANEWIGG